jgi:hypothetical protein
MWDRSMLVMTAAERELQDAQLALERALGCRELGDEARKALRGALDAIRGELAERDRAGDDRPFLPADRGEIP